MISLLAKQLSEVLTTKHQTREELCSTLKCKDRALRKAAAELRMIGFNIASSSHNKGYWLGNKQEMELVAREYDSRAYEDYRIASAIRKGPDLGQMEVKTWEE